jgi:hypothetical protein
LAQAFPSLKKLQLEGCLITGLHDLNPLLLFPQLRELHIVHCQLGHWGWTALPQLKKLPQLQRLVWLDKPLDQSLQHVVPRFDPGRICSTFAQLHQLTSITLGSTRIDMDPLVEVAAQLTQLVSVEVVHPEADIDAGQATDVLGCDKLEQLLSSCSLLTTLSMETVVLDQKGLDLLLAHPHITDVTLMAVSATESRVDSPCAWRTLRLPGQVAIGTVAYVPLHSLMEPLPVEALLLPWDVDEPNMPAVLLAATTRMAQHSHLFKLKDPIELVITDDVWELPSGKPFLRREYCGDEEEEELCK